MISRGSEDARDYYAADQPGAFPSLVFVRVFGASIYDQEASSLRRANCVCYTYIVPQKQTAASITLKLSTYFKPGLRPVPTKHFVRCLATSQVFLKLFHYVNPFFCSGRPTIREIKMCLVSAVTQKRIKL